MACLLLVFSKLSVPNRNISKNVLVDKDETEVLVLAESPLLFLNQTPHPAIPFSRLGGEGEAFESVV